MSNAVHDLLTSFDTLPAADKHQAAVEILRRVSTNHEVLNDDELVAVAEEVFLGLEAAESNHAKP